MKAVDFYKLPRAIQDRFVGSVMSGFPPAPLLVDKGGTSTKRVWLGVSVMCFVALVVVARLGYGALDSRLSLHSAAVLPVYAVLVFGVVFGLVQAFARSVRERALPYTSGVYLFPACVIDARDDQFRVYETRDLAAVDVVGSALRVAFAGGVEFLFPLPKPEMGPALVAEVQAARARSMHAHATEDPKELVAVDPLHVPRFSSPVGPRNAHELRRPPWGRFGAVVAGAVAVVLGPSLWAARNAYSDKNMYAAATRVNDSASYRLYMAHGRKFKDEVGGVLLPRSELRDAEKVGTVDALIAYRDEHPGSKIPSEVATSIRRAMLVELEKAKAPGTLATLKAFAAQYPDHGVQPELAAAIHAVYARELDAYKKRAPAKDKAAAAFVDRLFAWGEKHGAKIEIRFRRKAATTLERADQSVLKSPAFSGVVTYPSRYFDARHAAPREAALGGALLRLAPALAPELFEATLGALVEGDLPTPTVPTLFVTHVAEWSGHNYTGTRPRSCYVGVMFSFEAAFVIPGEAKPYTFKFDVFRHAATQVLKDEETVLAPGPAAEKVYEAMATDAFELFGKRLLANFVK